LLEKSKKSILDAKRAAPREWDWSRATATAAAPLAYQQQLQQQQQMQQPLKAAKKRRDAAPIWTKRNKCNSHSKQLRSICSSNTCNSSSNSRSTAAAAVNAKSSKYVNQ